MFKLVWTSQYGVEVVEEEIETLSKAEYLRNEYLLAYGTGSIEIARQSTYIKER